MATRPRPRKAVRTMDKDHTTLSTRDLRVTTDETNPLSARYRPVPDREIHWINSPVVTIHSDGDDFVWVSDNQACYGGLWASLP